MVDTTTDKKMQCHTQWLPVAWRARLAVQVKLKTCGCWWIVCYKRDYSSSSASLSAMLKYRSSYTLGGGETVLDLCGTQ